MALPGRVGYAGGERGVDSACRGFGPTTREIVIPPNIAPLNFLVEEPGVEYRVRIHGAEGKEIIIGSRNPSIVIPPRPWRRLLGQNRGGRIAFDIYAKDKEGRWSHFPPFGDDVAREEIDSHLVYRLLGPVCNLAIRN